MDEGGTRRVSGVAVNGVDHSYSRAPAIVLKTAKHLRANTYQREARICGSYGAERDVARGALVAAAVPWPKVQEAIDAADLYFVLTLGYLGSTPLDPPSNRRNC